MTCVCGVDSLPGTTCPDCGRDQPPGRRVADSRALDFDDLAADVMEIRARMSRAGKLLSGRGLVKVDRDGTGAARRLSCPCGSTNLVACEEVVEERRILGIDGGYLVVSEDSSTCNDDGEGIFLTCRYCNEELDLPSGLEVDYA